MCPRCRLLLCIIPDVGGNTAVGMQAFAGTQIQDFFIALFFVTNNPG